MAGLYQALNRAAHLESTSQRSSWHQTTNWADSCWNNMRRPRWPSMILGEMCTVTGRTIMIRLASIMCVVPPALTSPAHKRKQLGLWPCTHPAIISEPQRCMHTVVLSNDAMSQSPAGAENAPLQFYSCALFCWPVCILTACMKPSTGILFQQASYVHERSTRTQSPTRIEVSRL